MNFQLSEAQKMIKQTAKEFAKSEILPTVIQRDKNAEFPAEIIKKMGELGFLGMMVDPKYNGAGMDTVSYVLAIIEIAKVDASVAVIMSINNSLVNLGLQKWGSEFIKQKYLKPLAEGTKLGAFALSEPEAGSDATSQQTYAKLDGDNWILNGTKNWITNGQSADYYIVMAQTDKEKGYKGITAFVLEKGMEGFEHGIKEDKLGIRSSDTCTLTFTNCKIPQENVIGEIGKGFNFAMDTLNSGRYGIAAQAVGIAEGAFETAFKYAQERKAFGTEIFNHQAIQFKLSEMATNLEAAKLLTLKTATLRDEGKPFIKEASMAKLFSSKVAVENSLEAIQIHGGYGYVREYHVERFLRDAKVTEIYEGTSEIQKLVIARELKKNYC
ncbi:MAG: acyl-CoA dehydrogenase [Ignavibacteriae bacterium]|nr:MAG: acyl-CoA dehydrogenase [Ignavibacteriota bacterium]